MLPIHITNDKASLPFVITDCSSNDFDHFYKCSIVGAVSGVDLLLRYAEGTYTDSYIAKLDVNFKAVNKQVNDKNVKLVIWDQSEDRLEKNRGNDGSARGTAILFVIFDVRDPESFAQVESYIQCFKDRYLIQKPIIILVGMHIEDLASRVITEKMIEERAINLNCDAYGSCSAETGDNVENIFHTAIALKLKLHENAAKLNLINKLSPYKSNQSSVNPSFWARFFGKKNTAEEQQVAVDHLISALQNNTPVTAKDITHYKTNPLQTLIQTWESEHKMTLSSMIPNACIITHGA